MALSRTTITFLTTTLYLFFILSPTNAIPNPKARKPEATESPPYEAVNNFCLYRRLDVDRPFCLSVLKNRHAAYAQQQDLTPLLEVAVNSTSIFMCKTLASLQNAYEKRKSKAAEDCLAAYEDIAGYMTKVITEVSQDSIITGVNGEVIKKYINSCVDAVDKKTNLSHISDKNEEAEKYAKLMIHIADGLSSKDPL